MYNKNVMQMKRKIKKTFYMLKRILKMNYKGFLKTINHVHKKTKKSRITLFFDIIYCGLRFGAGYVDYEIFGMYDLTNKERNTIITRARNNEIIKKYNDKSKMYIFEKKEIFNKYYEKYLNREYIYLDNNLEDFKKYLKKKKEIIVKPTSLSCGKGVEKITVKDHNPEELYEKLIKNKQLLVEDVAIQHDTISKIYPLSINTVRIVTLNKKVVMAGIRFGNNGNVVDNFNHEGLFTKINIKTGKIDHPAIDKKGNVYEIHPYTNEPIVGLEIPHWKEIKKMCIEACNITPEIGYIGWDVCVGEKAPSLIEGNDIPGHDLYELPIQRDNNTGLMPEFEKAMK